MKNKAFIKKIFFHFILLQAVINLISTFGGMIFTNNGTLHYSNNLGPYLLAFLCLLPELVFYTNKELSIREIIIRKIVLLLIIEGIVICANILSGTFKNPIITCTTVIFVIIIFVIVNIINYLYDNRDAQDMTRKLTEYREQRNK